MKEKVIKVESESSLLTLLSNNLKDLSNKKIKSFIKHKMVEVDGKIEVNPSVMIFKGSIVRVIFAKREIPKMEVEIIYEDRDIIVINKPAGLLSIANRKEKEMTAFRLVSDYIKIDRKNARLFVVHRLDQATSGVLLFAKSEKIQELFQKNWNESVKLREYYAVVEGKTKRVETIESYLTMNHFQIVHSTKDRENGWYAKTYYETLRQNAKYSYIRVEIATGRRNQIRVHMSESGHAIVGDKKYGAKVNPIGRLALHASRLELIDPRSGKLISFSSKVPVEIESIVK